METWEVSAEVNIENLNLEDEEFPDDAVMGNTEIEMSVDETEQLIKRLQEAVSKIREK